MEKSISYKLPPTNKRLLSHLWLVFFSVSPCLGAFLIIKGILSPIYQSINPILSYTGFAILFFSIIYILRNIKYFRKFKFERIYNFDNKGIIISYSDKKEEYLWKNIKGWIESRKVDVLMYEKAPSRSGVDHLLSKTIASLGKKHLQTPNWIDLELKTGKIILLEIPENYFKK